jgi:hypothetical protein
MNCSSISIKRISINTYYLLPITNYQLLITYYQESPIRKIVFKKVYRNTMSKKVLRWACKEEPQTLPIKGVY